MIAARRVRYAEALPTGGWYALALAFVVLFPSLPDRYLDPGAPDANYVVIKFNTAFEKRKKAVETVVTIAGENGQFAVVGYYVQ